MIELNRLVAFLGLTYVHIYNYYHTNGFVFVEIDKGVLRGSNATTWRGEKYFSFKGIPYAKPPVDEFRFKGPREETAWAGVRDALHHGDVCPQIDMAFKIFRGKEDCLFLNVYTSSLEDKRMPVIFWIHGGMFMLGSGNDELWSPDYFMNVSVVLVTINYRLGALGFLSTEDDGAPGNAGLKDQVAALKWVKRNIVKFGGDPDNVTLFGGSSGGSSAAYHMLSSMSAGLFAKAISHSGSALNTWSISENAAEMTSRLVRALGAEHLANDTEKVLNFLKNVPCEEIVRAEGSLITAAERRTLLYFVFAPSVEKNVTSEEVFLSATPLEILKSGNYKKVPYITGYNDNEGCFFNDEIEEPRTMKSAFEDTERFVPIDIKNKELRNELAKSISKFYFDDKPVGIENVSNLVDVYSDTLFVTGIRRAVNLHLRSSGTLTYFFVFSHVGRMNHVKFFMNINRHGAVHGDELGYFFHSKILFWKIPVVGSEDEYVADTMIRLWINFAKYGNPTPPGDSLIWKPATSDEFNYLNIPGWETRNDVDPDSERTNFWANAYERNEALGS